MSRERGKGFLWGIIRKLNPHGKGKHGRRRTSREVRATRRNRRKQARKVFRTVVAEAFARGTVGQLFNEMITINGHDSSANIWRTTYVTPNPDRLEDHELHLVDCLFDEPDTDEAIGGPPLIDESDESDEPTDEA